MENVMNFLKDKFYFVIGGFVIFIIIIVIIVSCSSFSSNSYESLEEKLVEAGKEYYADNKKNLPKNEDETASVTLSFLVKNDYIKEIKDPKDKDNICSGEVEVTKRGNDYNYQGFLDCGKNYKTQFLVDALKSSLKHDDNGNGLYEMGSELVFRGDKLKNYVKFNDTLWQVMKIDAEGDIKLISVEPTEEDYPWDDRYNVKEDDNTGIGDFKKSRIRETLESYYRNNFNETEGVKEKIVKKDFCVAPRSTKDPINNTVECSDTLSMYVGLITASDFYIASLDSGCTKFLQEQCSNYNYLSREKRTWTLTSSKEETDRIYIFYTRVDDSAAADGKRIYPVINIDGKTISRGGTGTESNPYVVR